MTLSIKMIFTLTGQNGQKATLTYPFLNNDKELEFKYCSFYDGRVLLNREKQALEIQSKNKKVYILLKEKNEDLFKELVEVREAIISDLFKLSTNFKNGVEKIYLMETGQEQYPYLVSTPTIFENCLFSIKYQNAIIYYINQLIKKSGMKTEVKDYESMLKVVGNALKDKDLEKFRSEIYKEETGYLIPINQLEKLLKG